MTAVPAAAYLMDFAGEGRHGGGGRAGEVAARIEAAHASGFEAGRSAARAELEAKLAEQRAAASRELAAARQAWVREEAQRLSERLAAGLAELEAGVADAAARALLPVLRSELQQQAIADLRADLERLTIDPAVAITVRGRHDLLHALQAALSGSPRNVTYEPDGGADLRIAAGPAILETRLGAWAARIEEAVR
jgi:hypothetical protein